METKKAPDVVVDPTLDAQKAAADANLITNLQTQAAGDTASIMTRYGVNIALGHAGLSTATGAAPLRDGGSGEIPGFANIGKVFGGAVQV
jgi:hypothetical protein